MPISPAQNLACSASPTRYWCAAVTLGDEVLLGVGTDQPIWPTSTPDRPSPVQPPRYVLSRQVWDLQHEVKPLGPFDTFSPQAKIPFLSLTCLVMPLPKRLETLCCIGAPSAMLLVMLGAKLCVCFCTTQLHPLTGNRTYVLFLSSDSGHSSRADGFDRDADLFVSLDASDYSSDGGQVEASLAMATGGAVDAEAEADSCGYEGDVGEGTRKFTAAVRRAAVIAPPGFSTNRVSHGLRSIFCVTRVVCATCGVAAVGRSTWCAVPMLIFRASPFQLYDQVSSHPTLVNTSSGLLQSPHPFPDKSTYYVLEIHVLIL